MVPAGTAATWRGVWGGPHLKRFRQLVSEQFWSISKLRSMKTSSLFVMVSQRKHFVWLTSLPWKMSWTQVLAVGVADPFFCFIWPSRISLIWFKM